jgi:hypothetical protein
LTQSASISDSPASSGVSARGPRFLDLNLRLLHRGADGAARHRMALREAAEVDEAGVVQRRRVEVVPGRIGMDLEAVAAALLLVHADAAGRPGRVTLDAVDGQPEPGGAFQHEAAGRVVRADAADEAHRHGQRRQRTRDVERRAAGDRAVVELVHEGLAEHEDGSSRHRAQKL